MPTVSVIVPNYNHATFLTERLDSIFNQTFDDFEVILLDDCSQDNSVQILSAYAKHPKVTHFVINEINSGSPFKQWKKGIELAIGEYIWMAESDDWCEPDLLMTLVQGLTQKRKTVLAYCQSKCVNPDGSLGRTSKHVNDHEWIPGKIFVHNYMIEYNTVFNASMAIFKKSAFENISDDYTSFKFCGDWLFWSEMALNGDVFVSNKALNYFRNHDKDVSHKAYKSGYNYLEELRILAIFRKKKIINFNEYIKFLGLKYLHFRMQKRNMLPSAAEKVATYFDQASTNLFARIYLRTICYYLYFRDKLINLKNMKNAN
jgi:glycosyltransferase involved in cell wall biosynthesis